MGDTDARPTKRARIAMGGVEKVAEHVSPRQSKITARIGGVKNAGDDGSVEKAVPTDCEEFENGAVKCADGNAADMAAHNTGLTMHNDDALTTSGVVIVAATSTSKRNCKPGVSARWGHTMCMISKTEAVLIGGQGDRLMLSKDALWHFDIARDSWSVPDTSPITSAGKPEARMGHSAVYDHTMRAVYVYGGSKQKKWFSDVQMLDVDEWTWQSVKANGRAPTRSYHSCTLHSHELWIFGGIYPRPDPQPDGCSSEVFVFSPIEDGWYAPLVMGDKPLPRSGHSATLLQGRLVVFGGWDAPVCYNDLHILDLALVEWSRPVVTTSPPAPRSWHSSCALSNNRVLIHGGYNGNVALDDAFIFDLDTSMWTCLRLESPLSPRAGHTALCLPYRHDYGDHDEVIIFGGGNNEGAFYQELVSIAVPRAPLAITSGHMSMVKSEELVTAGVQLLETLSHNRTGVPVV